MGDDCSFIPSAWSICSGTIRGSATGRVPHQRRPTAASANRPSRDQVQGRWLLEGMLCRSLLLLRPGCLLLVMRDGLRAARRPDI
ncbi:hypothetical protein CRG98_038562 [Punica granatum]|uniref:Uncharacterized protein n=1 Tax=Punica granatum TaxID=22663 RepID=A0A2I0IAK7_PUNGR|nr:hypothetical protein CRG98_038562 [Punica granatum]